MLVRAACPALRPVRPAAVLERQLEDVEIDKLPGAVNRALGFDVFGRRCELDRGWVACVGCPHGIAVRGHALWGASAARAKHCQC